MVGGSKQLIMIIIINIILIFLLIYYIFKNYSNLTNIEKLSIAMILGGGIGNLIDRIFRGYVIDYIDINKFFKYPLFNLADIFIVIGFILIIIYLIIGIVRKQRKE